MNPIDQPQTATDWRSVKIHFGKKAGTKLGDMSARDLPPVSRMADLMRRVSLRRQAELARPFINKNQTQKPR